MKHTYLSTNDFLFLSIRSESETRKFLQLIKSKYDDFSRVINNKYFFRKDLLLYFQYPPGSKIEKFIFGLKKKNSTAKKRNDINSYQGYWKKELSKKDWHLFGHVSYLDNYSTEDCMYFFYKLKKFLKREIKVNIEIFYTTERNKERGGGHHNHFVLRTDCVNALSDIKVRIDSFFRRNNFSFTDIKKYNMDRDGLSYILKEIDTVKDGFDLILTRKSF